MINNICPKEHCIGCAACYNICNKKAIIMDEDKNGFLYPSIDKTICIECDACINICPVNDPLHKHNPIHAFAAISKDYSDLMSSSSGGASSVFINSILDKGGVAYGCVQNNYLDISHRRIEDKSESYKFKGSKYVQSIINDIFKYVRNDLKNNKKVIFTGTPCQIAGLKKYLKKDFENLITIDLVCHGIASQKTLQENIKNILNDNHITDNNKNIFVSFRHKKNGSINFGLFIKRLDSIKNIFTPIINKKYPFNYFIFGFMKGYFYRENCFNCQYACKDRISDITIGDFWGLGDSDLNTKNGISLILTNTSKGDDFFQSIRHLFVFEKRTVDEAVKGNGQLQHAFKKPKYYDIFFNLHNNLNNNKVKFFLIKSMIIEYIIISNKKLYQTLYNYKIFRLIILYIKRYIKK